MSSPDVESPFSMYSFPSEATLSTPQPASEPLSPPDSSSSEQRLPPRPRLRSPDLFRDIFGVRRNGQSPAPPSSVDRSGLNYIYQETMNDVNRAIQSASRAVQSAQEAFQSRRSSPRNELSQQEVVDLTGTSPPPAEVLMIQTNNPTSTGDGSYDDLFSRFTHPHDMASRRHPIHNLLNEPSYGSRQAADDDSMSRYAGPDSLAGPRRRWELHQQSYASPANHTLTTGRSRGGSARDDEAAIRRQTAARAQWEDNQRRTAERHRLAEQRQRLLQSTTGARDRMPASFNGHYSSPTQRRASVNSSSSVEAVDLTQVDDHSSLAAALAKQRQDAIASQNESSQSKTSNSGIGSGGGRSALTAYKCPICMEAPQDATTTSCGHLFCHKCIIDTLKWSEQARRDEVPASRKVRGVCPVCRKELARKEDPGHGRTLIPLEIKLISRKEMKRKWEEEEAEQRRKQAVKKGKQKIYHVSGDEAEDDYRGDLSQADRLDRSSPSQKENRFTKRVKTAADEPTDLDSLFDFQADDSFL